MTFALVDKFETFIYCYIIENKYVCFSILNYFILITFEYMKGGT